MNKKRTRMIGCLMVIITLIMFISIITTFQGCDLASFDSMINDIKGSLIGISFDCEFYDNNGKKFMNVSGDKIDIEPNIVQEYVYNDGSYGYIDTLSSVITITVDGSQIESCGSTVLFIEKGLKAEVDFNQEELKDIESGSDGFNDNTMIASIVNYYKNSFGKATVVVIQSQLGDPICAFSGDDVYWEVCNDLPKTTKLMIDGKALYIHRANFQIIDKDLLD